MTLGERVKLVRDERGWSQAELARRVTRLRQQKTHQVAIHHIEARGNVSPRFVVELAQALQVNLDWLRRERGPRESEPRAAKPAPTLKKPATDNSKPRRLETETATPGTAVRSYVGAGDEIISLQDDEEPLYWTPSPPGLEDAEATQVRGESMAPLYHDGDLLFHRRHAIDPLMLRGEVVILQTRSRKRMVKMILPGSKKGYFHLVSFNSLNPPIEDQQIAWVAPILWVKKRQRF